MLLDENHPFVREMRAKVSRRLATARSQLEALTTPPERTAELRGRIAELKHLLDWKGEDAE